MAFLCVCVYYVPTLCLQVVSRTMTTEQHGGKTITVTKTTVSTVSQGVTLAGADEEEESEVVY